MSATQNYGTGRRKTATARVFLRQAAWKLDRKAPDATKFCAMAKLYVSECMVQSSMDAIQIFGGYGYTMDYPVERMMRDAKICEIGEGTSEVQRMLIARGLGLPSA